jgi:hypothetical protein
VYKSQIPVIEQAIETAAMSYEGVQVVKAFVEA